MSKHLFYSFCWTPNSEPNKSRTRCKSAFLANIAIEHVSPLRMYVVLHPTPLLFDSPIDPEFESCNNYLTSWFVVAIHARDACFYL